MTTIVKVIATHGWPVRVTPLALAGAKLPETVIEAGETKDFYVHSGQDLLIHEIQPGETAAASEPSSFQPLPVAGYTTQSADKVDLFNQNKALEERVLRQLDLLLAMDSLDKRNLALAKTHFEDAFMRMNRAVFPPGRISLPEDGK